MVTGRDGDDVVSCWRPARLAVQYPGVWGGPVVHVSAAYDVCGEH